ncbi:MAG: leucine-rich repeat protein, partial [Victivallaceae bacterium]
NCENLKQINIPPKVTKIENCAFMNCINLKAIKIPDSVTEIASTAFHRSPVEDYIGQKYEKLITNQPFQP